MLATITDMGSWRAIPGDLDPAANLALSAADKWVKGFLGRDVEGADYALRLSGDGTPLLYPKNWPVRSVSSLIVDGEPWGILTSADEADSSQEAFLDPTGLCLEARGGRVFTQGAGNIFLRYCGGYETIPGDLVLVTAMAAHLIHLERERLGDNQRTFGQVQVNEYLRSLKQYPFMLDTLQRYTFFGISKGA